MAATAFIERSERRIRFARATFVLVGILPCAALVAWAIHLRSAAHREGVRGQWQRVVGVPLEVESVEHPRPGVVRARGCRLAATDDEAVALPVVEVETAPSEVRLRIDRIACDAAAARLLGGLVAEWLGREARYPRDCVVEIAACAWPGLAPDATATGLRAECVNRAGARAVRIVRSAGTDERPDEFRVVRTVATDSAAERLEIDLACGRPLPWAVVAAAVGRDGFAPGSAVTVTGTLHAVREGGLWSGKAAGQIAAIDLAACTASMQARASGTATAVVRGLEWARGRILSAEVEVAMGRGRMEQRLLDGLVGTMGCRAGPAHRTLGGAVERAVDGAGCLLRIDARGLELVSGSNLGGALVVAEGLAVVEPPVALIPPERLAWLLAPAGAVFVPSGGPGAWLLDVMPRADQTGRPRGGGGF